MGRIDRQLRLGAGWAVLASLMLVLGACGQKELSTAQQEAAIKKQLHAQTKADVASVDCHSHGQAQEGDSFNCTARAVDGSSLPIRVRRTDDKGGFTWDAAPVDQNAVESKLFAAPNDPGVSWRVADCPDLVEATEGTRFKCAVTSSGSGKYSATVTITDNDGHFKYVGRKVTGR